MIEPFARVPRCLQDDPDIEALDIAIYAAVSSFAFEEAGTVSRAPLDGITTRAKVSKGRALSGIARLEARGYIAVDRSGRTGNRKATNTYTLITFQGSRAESSNGERSPNEPAKVHVASKSSISSRISKIEPTPSLATLVPAMPVEDGKPKKPAGKKPKPEPLPQPLLDAYHALEHRLKTIAEAEGITWVPAKEGKHLRFVVRAYAEKIDRLPALTECFLALRRGKDRFWQETSPLPSSLASRLSQVETAMASKPTRYAPQESATLTCKFCGKTYPRGSYCKNRACLDREETA